MKKILALVILLVLLGLAVSLRNSIAHLIPQQNASSTPSNTATSSPVGEAPGPDPLDQYMGVAVTATLRGTSACLPHKGDGPQTLECALGMKADDGYYYALDFNSVQSTPVTVPTGERIVATGLLVPIEAVNSNSWQRYDIKGIMKISSYDAGPNPAPVIDYSKKLTAELNVPFTYKDTTITAWAVTEDSRCPKGVMCVQAGTVKVALKLESSRGSAIAEVTLGKAFVADSFVITLDDVVPVKISDHKITDSEYRLMFSIGPKE